MVLNCVFETDTTLLFEWHRASRSGVFVAWCLFRVDKIAVSSSSMATRTSIRWYYLWYSAKVVIGSLECINVSLQPRWLVQRMPRLLRVKGMRKKPPHLAGKEHGVSCTYVQYECKCRHCHVPKCKPSAWYGTFLSQNKSKTQTTRSLTHSIPIRPDYSRTVYYSSETSTAIFYTSTEKC